MKSVKDIFFFNQINTSDIAKVGCKNASLKEMYNQLNPKKISIHNRFSTTADAYRLFRPSINLEQKLNNLLLLLDTEHYSNLSTIGEKKRGLIVSEELPQETTEPIIKEYKRLSSECGIVDLDVAVRSSATGEELAYQLKILLLSIRKIHC